MLVYRIVHKKYSSGLFASGLKGRWNSPGKKVIYTAESIPLAFLVNMIRRQGVGFNSDFKILFIDIPDSIKIMTVEGSDLEDGWRDFKDYSKCQIIGDKWYDERKTMILKVPSAVLSDSYNYVINTEISDYRLVKLIEVTDLVPDDRIEDILKRYPEK